MRLLPTHNLYAEPFFGGGAVFFAKEPSAVEVINDKNGFVVNFYRECQNNFDALQAMIKATPHARKSHQQAMAMYTHPELFTSLQCA